MSDKLRPYHAVVWDADPETPGIRCTYFAKNLNDAIEQLEREHGKGKLYSLYNDEDAEKPR